ncbi:uncharacterized protein LOC116260215 [Nymphaea colorata]|uniref:uncharacterized protein LOC116260215 n=1 Tax=Nymphaea colorata TaxID=210225 RepID=UPI00129EB1FA|nr:uncharacterized protein LOC116260215 [Nymphaea colorata]
MAETQGAIGSSSRSEMIAQDDNLFYLHHSDIPSACLVSQPLTGDNYETWRRAMTMALLAKNKMSFVDGSLPKPTSPASLVISWERCNNMVISWLLNAIHKPLMPTVVYAKEAAFVWKELKIRFTQSNAPRLYQIQQQIINCKQGQSPISIYYTRIKGLWDEYDAYVTPPVCDCGAIKKLTEIQERDKLIQFLMSLNESYGPIRSQILLMEPMPDTPRLMPYWFKNKDSESFIFHFSLTLSLRQLP